LALACGQAAPDTGDAGDGGGGGDVTTKDVVKTDVVAKDSPNDVAPDVVVPFDAGPPPPIGGKPPPPPDAGTPTTSTYTFAITAIYLGDINRTTKTASSTAWKDFGYDVDGLQTTSSSTNVCTLASGAPKFVQVDGTNGIDNSFGANIMPIIQTAASLPTPSIDETKLIDQGAFTLQIQVTGLSDDPQQDALGVTSQVFVSGDYGSTPAFDSTTDWPVLSTSVQDGKTIASGSTVQFKSSYVSGGTFVSGVSGAAIPLQFSASGIGLPITIHDGVITFTHPSHSVAAWGVISGVVYTQEFLDALQALAGQISTSLCGSAFDGIAQQIRQAQEILQDGSNNANASCDAISIGIGFDAVLVHDPTTVATAPPPPPNPCGD
jgi:hypothetical protein